MKFRKKNTVFILSLFDTGLGAIRSLGRIGIPVIGLDSDPDMPGFKSKYCKAKLCPDPVHRPEELAEFLLNEGRKLECPGILIPASDAFVLFLSRFRNDLSAFYNFLLPPSDVLEAIINKRLQYEMAEKIGTPYSKTFYPETLKDVEQIQKDLEYPAFIKPYCGHLWREKFGGTHKGFKIHTAKELKDRYEEILPTGLQAMVQSIILGPNTNHFKVNVYIGKAGKPLAIFTLRKIRQYPTEFGIGTMVESIHYPELAELGLKFFKGIGYRGIGSIEFKKDDRDGKLKMIELNPRLWQQNIHPTICGINFPLIQYLDLTNQNLLPQMEFKDGIKWWDSMADFQAFWVYFRKGELSPAKWIRSLNGIKSFATFAFDDPLPFLKSHRYGLKFLRLPKYIFRNML